MLRVRPLVLVLSNSLAAIGLGLVLKSSDDGGGPKDLKDVCATSHGCCQHGPLKNPPEKPLKFVLSDSCTGSTAIMEVAKELHNAAGAKVADCNGFEILHDLNQGDYGFPVGRPKLLSYFKSLVNNTASRGMHMLVKDPADYVISDPQLSKYIANHAHVAIALRRNLIDQSLCSIRDGFSMGKGLGSCKSCGTFRGRGEDEKTYNEKIKLKADVLVEGLWNLTQVHQKRIWWMRKEMAPSKDKKGFVEQVSNLADIVRRTIDQALHGRNADDDDDELDRATPVDAEDLFEYEWNPDGLKTSVHAWHNFMKLLGSAKIEKEVIEKYLSKRLNSRPAPKPHKELIENYHEAKMAVGRCTENPTYNTAWCEYIGTMFRD